MTTALQIRRPISLSGIDSEIVKVLTHRVRVVSADQIARAYWPDAVSARRSAAIQLSRLVARGLAQVSRSRVHPELPLDGALWSWTPGDSEPPFGVLSYRLRVRWTESLRTVPVYMASPRAARFNAGHGGRLRHPLQTTHDLHVSTIYFRLRKDSPEMATRWVSEEALRKRNRFGKLPDAEIHDQHGHVLKVIEFGGSYPPERLRLVHEDCARREVPYELW